jgi:hypothetical protein
MFYILVISRNEDIERIWKCGKKDDCLNNLGTKCKDEIKSLMSLKFQIYSSFFSAERKRQKAKGAT